MQAWIKVSVAISRHRKTIKLARMWKIPERKVADLLIRFFCWARDGAGEDGYIGAWRSIDVFEGIHAEDYFGDDELKPEFTDKAWEQMDKAGWIRDGWIEDWPEWGGAHVWDRAKKNPKKFPAMIHHYRARQKENDLELEPDEDKEKKYRPAKTAAVFINMYKEITKNDYPWNGYTAKQWKGIADAHKWDDIVDQEMLNRTVRTFYGSDWGKKVGFSVSVLLRDLSQFFNGGTNGGRDIKQEGAGLNIGSEGLGLRSREEDTGSG